MKVGVLGGGTMGLTLAHRLSNAGHTVTVLESAGQLGGLATWFDYDGFIWDKYYHVILASDAQLIGLIDELGILPHMRWAETKTGFLWNNQHLSMSNHWEFLTFPALTLIDKARLALGILRCQRIVDPEPLERMKASAWLRDLFGVNVYRAIWEPLLESKFGVLKDEIPATIMWATITRYYSTRAKGDGREKMGYLAGGLKTLYDSLEKSISAHGGAIRRNAPVARVDNSGPGSVHVDVGAEILEFDRVINTTPTALLRRLAPSLEGVFRDGPAPPKFLGVICVALVLRRPLSANYVTNLIQKGFPFTGIIGVSNLTGPDAMGGHHLVMLPRYEAPDSPLFDTPDDAIATEFIAALKPVWPDIESNIVRYFVNRERRVQALWIDGPPVIEPHAPRTTDGRVWNVNSELTGRDTLNNNGIVRAANQAAEEFLKLNPV